MKPKHARLRFLLLSLLIMGGAATAILYSFRDNMVFFYTPTQLIEKRLEPAFDASRPLRVGGLVKQGSIINRPKGGISFTITDLTHELTIDYSGMIPSLFRDGQGVVAQGHLCASCTSPRITADNILAKHDETYMPREVMEELKKSGRWKGGNLASAASIHPSENQPLPKTRTPNPETTP
jgi:cytochrome c-type biogenesis protein CcmE